jgi:hypothetical protein
MGLSRSRFIVALPGKAHPEKASGGVQHMGDAHLHAQVPWEGVVPFADRPAEASERTRHSSAPAAPSRPVAEAGGGRD